MTWGLWILVSGELQFTLYSVWNLPLSLHFNGHFPGGPGLAGTRMSPFWILLELMVMEMVVTTRAIRWEKQSSPTNQHQVFFIDRLPFLSPNQQCQSTKGKHHTMCVMSDIFFHMKKMMGMGTTYVGWVEKGKLVGMGTLQFYRDGVGMGLQLRCQVSL